MSDVRGIMMTFARAHCDPWVSVMVNRDRRSLRRRPPSPITQFRTKVSEKHHSSSLKSLT